MHHWPLSHLVVLAAQLHRINEHSRSYPGRRVPRAGRPTERRRSLRADGSSSSSPRPSAGCRRWRCWRRLGCPPRRSCSRSAGGWGRSARRSSRTCPLRALLSLALAAERVRSFSRLLCETAGRPALRQRPERQAPAEWWPSGALRPSGGAFQRTRVPPVPWPRIVSVPGRAASLPRGRGRRRGQRWAGGHTHGSRSAAAPLRLAAAGGSPRRAVCLHGHAQLPAPAADPARGGTASQRCDAVAALECSPLASN